MAKHYPSASEHKAIAELQAIANEAKTALGKMSAISSLLEAALRVLMKHDLLEEFAHEFAIAERPLVAEQPLAVDFVPLGA